MKINRQTTFTTRISIDGKDIDLPLSHEPASVMNYHPERLFASQDGQRLALGYLVDDNDCQSPLEDEGEGFVFTARRHAGAEEHAKFREALGLDENWQRDPDLTPSVIAVRLDIYEHGGISYSVSGEGMQDQFDTARNGAVWVPDQTAYENINESARQKNGGNDPTDTQIQEAAREYARGILESYNAWMNGECYGVVIEEYAKTDDGEYESIREPEVGWGMIGSKYAYEDLDSQLEAMEGLMKIEPPAVQRKSGRKP